MGYDGIAVIWLWLIIDIYMLLFFCLAFRTSTGQMGLGIGISASPSITAQEVLNSVGAAGPVACHEESYVSQGSSTKSRKCA